jgi:Ser/Thr protein kinase RdoA (MazF antagonist)
VDAGAAASILSEVTGKPFRVVGQLVGGETGAHQFVGPEGEAVVVKWDTTDDGRAFRGESVALSERLRQAGWPVPAASVIEADDVTFVIQEFMPGTPPTTLDHRLVDQLLDLHACRLGLAAPDDPRRWPANLITTIAVGGNGYCRHGSLRTYDGRTRSLVERIEAFGRTLTPDDFVGDDVVHWDLHPGNLLVEEGRIAAVVDTDFAMVGDARFDLVMLALTSSALDCEQGVSSRLFAEALHHLDEVRAQAFLAHLFVRLIDWPIRRHSPTEVEFWLARADELLTI